MNRTLGTTSGATALLLCAVVSYPAHAALTLYSNAASFAAAAPLSFTDSFNDLALDFTPSPLPRSSGSNGYTATASGGFYAVGTAADVWLSTDLSGDAITFGSFAAGTRAFGGLFFGTDIDGGIVSGQSITLMATDSTGSSLSTTLVSPNASSFVGFVSSNGSLVDVQVSIADRDSFIAVNNLVTAVPEPSTWATLLAGIVAIGARLQRRRTTPPRSRGSSVLKADRKSRRFSGRARWPRPALILLTYPSVTRTVFSLAIRPSGAAAAPASRRPRRPATVQSKRGSGTTAASPSVLPKVL